MTAPTVEAVTSALSDFADPETGRSALQQGQIRDVAVAGNNVALTLALSTHSAPLRDATVAELQQLLRGKFPQVANVEIRTAVHDRPPLALGRSA